MAQPEIIVTDQVDPLFSRVVTERLNQFNDDITGYGDRRPLAVVVRDPGSGEPVGGAIGRTSLGALFLEMFYLPPALRGSGIGTQVLRAFEAEGRRRGCLSGVVSTISFQAPGFYQRNGWRIFGEVPCDPPGTSRIFLTKDLRA